MAALGDTFIKTYENTQYKFTCISIKPEIWFCPTPFCAKSLLSNKETSPYASSTNDIIYYTANNYNAIITLENFIFTALGKTYYSTLMLNEDTFNNNSYHNKNIMFLNSFHNVVISKFIKNDQMCLKLTFPADTYNYSINIQTLGFQNSASSFTYNQNQCAFFSIFNTTEYTEHNPPTALCQTLQFRSFSTTLPFKEYQRYLKYSAYANTLQQVRLPIYLMYCPSIVQNQNRLFLIFNKCQYTTYSGPEGKRCGIITLSSTAHKHKVVLDTDLSYESLKQDVSLTEFQKNSYILVDDIRQSLRYYSLTGKFKFTYKKINTNEIYQCIYGVLTGTTVSNQIGTILFFNRVNE